MKTRRRPNDWQRPSRSTYLTLSTRDGCGGMSLVCKRPLFVRMERVQPGEKPPPSLFSPRSAHLINHFSSHSTVLLASKLTNVGYNVSVRMALGPLGEKTSPTSSPNGKDNLHRASDRSACFRNLRHEFLLVRGQGEYEGLEYVVDLAFRDQFEIPQPSSSYHELLGDVPQVFVGPVSSLIPVVQIVCSEMAVSFTIRGQTLPPWRKTEAILSKWLPQHVKDTPLAQMDNGGREVDRRQMARGTFEAKGSKQGSLRKTIQGFHVGGITPSSFKGSPL